MIPILKKPLFNSIEDIARESEWRYYHLDRFLFVQLGIEWTDVIADIWTLDLITENDAHKYVDMYKRIKSQEKLSGVKYEDLFGFISFETTQFVCPEISNIQFRVSDGFLHSIKLHIKYNNNFEYLTKKIQEILNDCFSTQVLLRKIRFVNNGKMICYFNDKDQTTIYFSFEDESNSTLTISYM